MKKKVTFLVVAVMVLATVAAYAGTATINLNVSVTLPTYLSMTLSDGSTQATEGGSLTSEWLVPTGATPGPGVYATSEQYTLSVVCNDAWDVNVQLPTGKLTSWLGTDWGTDTLQVAMSYGTTSMSAFADMPGTAVPTASGDIGDSTDSHYQFRVPYALQQRAGLYKGTIVFTAVCP